MTRRSLLLSVLLLLAPALVQSQQVVGPLYTETTTIANGESVSGTIDTKGRSLVGVIMPASWTAARLTFQVSLDGSTWNDLYNLYGDEFTSEAAASRFVAMSPYEFLPVRYVRIRSGTSGTPVNQGGARTLKLMTRKFAE